MTVGKFIPMTDPVLLPPYRGKKIHFEPLQKGDKSVLMMRPKKRRRRVLTS